MVPPFRGRLRGREHGTRTEGGVSQKQPGGVSHPPLPLFAVVVRVVRPRPADPNRASGEGRDGSDPPFFTAGAVRQEGGCPTQCPTGCPIPSPPLGGSLPSVGIPAIWTPPSMQGFHPSWKGEIRRSLLTGGRNCASGYLYGRRDGPRVWRQVLLPLNVNYSCRFRTAARSTTHRSVGVAAGSEDAEDQTA